MDVILSGLSLLHEPDEIIEIRSIDPKPVISGYFRADSPAIAKELSRYPNRTFYQTMNRVKSACYAREQHERLVERPHETTTDGDIAGYQWLLIDADPVRPSGVSASREEKEAARRVAGMTMKKLMAMGFSEPIVADSGNGYHLLFHIHASPKEKQVLADFLACGSAQSRSRSIPRSLTRHGLPSSTAPSPQRVQVRRKGLTAEAESSGSRKRLKPRR